MRKRTATIIFSAGLLITAVGVGCAVSGLMNSSILSGMFGSILAFAGASASFAAKVHTDTSRTNVDSFLHYPEADNENIPDNHALDEIIDTENEEELAASIREIVDHGGASGNSPSKGDGGGKAAA